MQSSFYLFPLSHTRRRTSSSVTWCGKFGVVVKRFYFLCFLNSGGGGVIFLEIIEFLEIVCDIFLEFKFNLCRTKLDSSLLWFIKS